MDWATKKQDDSTTQSNTTFAQIALKFMQSYHHTLSPNTQKITYKHTCRSEVPSESERVSRISYLPYQPDLEALMMHHQRSTTKYIYLVIRAALTKLNATFSPSRVHTINQQFKISAKYQFFSKEIQTIVC